MVSMPGIPSMPAIWQTCSSWSRVVTAITLPPITSARIKDENRFSIALKLSTKTYQVDGSSLRLRLLEQQYIATVAGLYVP